MSRRAKARADYSFVNVRYCQSRGKSRADQELHNTDRSGNRRTPLAKQRQLIFKWR